MRLHNIETKTVRPYGVRSLKTEGRMLFRSPNGPRPGQRRNRARCDLRQWSYRRLHRLFP